MVKLFEVNSNVHEQLLFLRLYIASLLIIC